MYTACAPRQHGGGGSSGGRTCGGVHATPGDEPSHDELVWVAVQDLAVLARARLALIRVHDEVLWAAHTRASASVSALCTVGGTYRVSCAHPGLFMKLHLSPLRKPVQLHVVQCEVQHRTMGEVGYDEGVRCAMVLIQDYKVHDVVGAACSGKLFDDVRAAINTV